MWKLWRTEDKRKEFLVILFFPEFIFWFKAELIATKDEILKKVEKEPTPSKFQDALKNEMKIEIDKKNQYSSPINEKSPEFKKSSVLKGAELSEKQVIDAIPIRISYANEPKKTAAITVSRASIKNAQSVVIKDNKPSGSGDNSKGKIDYLSVLKKGPSNQNVNYLANLLADGTVKKSTSFFFQFH